MPPNAPIIAPITVPIPGVATTVPNADNAAVIATGPACAAASKNYCTSGCVK